ncbi:hypothetical protein JCM6882_008047 [Rhodosporidiobolus microsporus]
METQEPSLDLSTLSHALPTSPSTAEPEKVTTASLSTLPPELKLKIVEEVYESIHEHHEWDVFEQLPKDKLARSTRLRKGGKPTDLASLSLVSREWHDMCVPRLWETLILTRQSAQSLVVLLDEILPKYSVHVRGLVLGQRKADEVHALAKYERFGFVSPRLSEQAKLRRQAARQRTCDRAASLSEARVLPPGPLYPHDVKDLLVAEVVRACSGLRELGTDPIHTSCLSRTFKALGQSAHARSLEAVRLQPARSLLQHADSVSQMLKSSSALRHLSIDCQDSSSGAIAPLFSFVDSLAPLDLLALFNISPSSLHPALVTPLQHIHLSFQPLSNDPSDALRYSRLEEFLRPHRSTLHTLVLRNYALEDCDTAPYDLDKLSKLVLSPSIDFCLHLHLFHHSPLTHLYVDECSPSELPTIYHTLERLAATLRVFQYGAKALRVECTEARRAEEWIWFLGGWCEAHGVQYRLPIVVCQGPSRWSGLLHPCMADEDEQ